MSPMAIITEKAILLLIVIGFLQVQARSTEFVFGPRAHLDSGQELFDGPLQTPFLDVRVELPFHLSETNVDLEDENEGLLLPFEEEDFSEEYEGNEESDSVESSEEDGDQSREEDNADEEDWTSDTPLKRVRRRIIPVGGAIDRSRGDRGNSGRSRSPWSEPHHYSRQRETIIRRRTGPTGSAALFSLYPELAPPEWKAKKDIEIAPKRKKKKKSKDISHDDPMTTVSPPKKIEKERTEEKPQSDERAKTSLSDPVSLASKRNSKLNREMKQEIAMFAELHGIDRAIQHYKSRIGASLRPHNIEKFLRRYHSRLERRANRRS